MSTKSQPTGIITKSFLGFEARIETAIHYPKSLPVCSTIFHGKMTLKPCLETIEAAISHIRKFGYQGEIEMVNINVDFS